MRKLKLPANKKNPDLLELNHKLDVIRTAEYENMAASILVIRFSLCRMFTIRTTQGWKGALLDLL